MDNKNNIINSLFKIKAKALLVNNSTLGKLLLNFQGVKRTKKNTYTICGVLVECWSKLEESDEVLLFTEIEQIKEFKDFCKNMPSGDDTSITDMYYLFSLSTTCK